MLEFKKCEGEVTLLNVNEKVNPYISIEYS